MTIEPSLVLSVLVGLFHAAVSVAIRGSAGGRLPVLVAAAILGAWAGDAIFGRLGIGILTLGLVAFGLVMVYSATSASAAIGNGDPMSFLKRQAV